MPAFLPDATQGVVRSLDAQDLLACQIQAIQMNVYHLMQKPGATTVRALGGMHGMAGWTRPIFTDSGGFQVYSLIRQNPKSGSITDRGATFRAQGTSRKINLTPEKSVQLQLSFGADMVICLDDCTHPDDARTVQAESVKRTVAWARRCKRTYIELAEQKGWDDTERPRLMAVVQGGASAALREQCAAELLEIGFDAFGYGGWPVDKEGELLIDMLAYTRELIPEEYPLHALGVGQPASVLACAELGYQLFDSTMPTRDARHGRLFAFTVDPASEALAGDWFQYIYVKDDKYTKLNKPVSAYCDCLACSRYSLGYLHHLYKLNDSLYQRLATLHNLRFMTQLMAHVRDRQ